MLGCAPVPKWPAALSLENSDQVRAVAIQDAKRDLAEGAPRVCYAGVGKVQAVGVAVEHLPLVENLPRVALPTGTYKPQVMVIRAYVYAEAYNRQVVAYLLKEPEP